MTDEYSFWRDALAGKFGPVHDDDPQPGFYRKRTRRAGPFVPVAIWRDGERMVAFVDGRAADASEIWTFVCQHPISEEAYHQALNGDGWDDLDEGVAEQAADRRNSDPEDDAESLRDQVEAARERIAEYASVTSDEQAAKAQSLRARLNELAREADKKRDALKRPHLEAGKAVDAEWQPIIKSAKAGADQVAKAIGEHETRKLRERREAERRAEEARRQQEEAARAAEAANKPAPPPPATPEPEPAPAPTTTIRGGYGRAASVSVENVVTGITDQDALYTFLRDHPELKEKMFDLARRAVVKGHSVPGVSVEERARVA